jgi:hypothetical protein
MNAHWLKWNRGHFHAPIKTVRSKCASQPHAKIYDDNVVQKDALFKRLGRSLALYLTCSAPFAVSIACKRDGTPQCFVVMEKKMWC